MNLGLKGKVVGISGAGSSAGIGFAAAKALMEEGAKLFFCDINEAAVKEVGAQLSSFGEVLPLVANVAQKASVDEMFAAAMKHYGRVDIWINNAGIYPQKMLMDTTPEEWDLLMGVNLRSVLLCTQAAARCMEGHEGVVLNAASYAAVLGSVGSAGYAASKAAVLSLTKTFAAELAPRGIRVCAYIPGVIATPMTGGVIAQKGDALLGQLALNRLGTPEDVAKAIVFLSSDAAGYITGAALEISGGKLCVQNPDAAWNRVK
jgi:NAD(P)-dependent dehydrogenase (short-subunit alcohol dehydrogenase family)